MEKKRREREEESGIMAGGGQALPLTARRRFLLSPQMQNIYEGGGLGF